MYCFCKGQVQVSLLDIQDDCEKEIKSHTNCCKTTQCNQQESEKEVKSCCSKFAKYKKTTEKPCTTKGKKYLKADLKFFLSEKEEKKSKSFDFQHITKEFQEKTLFSNLVFQQFLSAQPTHAPPPRIYGRELLAFVQNYRQ